MLRKLLWALILVLLLELTSLVWLVRHIGLLPTMGVTALGTVVGAGMAKHQGRRVFRDWQAALASGQPPAAGALDAMLVVASGILFALPGLLTDALGLILLWPPARRLSARYLRRWLQRHAGSMPRPFEAGQDRARTAPGSEIVDTEGVEVSDSALHPSEPPRLPGERLH